MSKLWIETISRKSLEIIRGVDFWTLSACWPCLAKRMEMLKIDRDDPILNWNWIKKDSGYTRFNLKKPHAFFEAKSRVMFKTYFIYIYILYISSFPRWRSRVFWKSDFTDPSSDFWCVFFGKYQFRSFRLSFFSWFLYQDLIWVRWFHSLFEWIRLKRKNDVYSH